MRKLGKKVKLDKKSLQAYAFCVCTNCPCPSGTNSYTAKYNDSERKAKQEQLGLEKGYGIWQLTDAILCKRKIL